VIVKLTNDFHGTVCYARVDPNGRLSERQARRVNRELCGFNGCSCSGGLGLRGPQNWSADQEYNPVPGESVFFSGWVLRSFSGV